MNGFPTELLFALVLAGVMFVQHLMKRSGHWPQSDDEAQAAPVTEVAPGEQDPLPCAPRASLPDLPAIPEAGAARAKAKARQRMTVRALLDDGQDLQRAVVGMTVLGPCRALEPPERR
jgi:hypothetical protein